MTAYVEASGMHAAGPVWASEVFSTRNISKEHLKAFQKAMADFKRTMQKPPFSEKVFDWIEKRLPSMQLLFEAINWPAKQVSDDPSQGLTFRIGPFVVHNLAEADTDNLSRALLDCAEVIKSSGVNGFEKVLYGDVYFVRDFQSGAGHNVLASYNSFRDIVLVKVFSGTRGKAKALAEFANSEYRVRHSIIHELGHRFWFKVLTDKQRAAWVQRHQSVQGTHDQMLKDLRASAKDLIKVNTYLPSDITYKGAPIFVQEVIGQSSVRALVEGLPGGNTMLRLDYDGLVNQIVQRKTREMTMAFPTEYAAKNHEEHFAEAVALLAQKKLAGGHEEPLREVMRSAEGKGLWHNIRKKRRRGKRPARPGESDYPDAKTWDKLTKKPKK